MKTFLSRDELHAGEFSVNYTTELGFQMNLRLLNSIGGCRDWSGEICEDGLD